MSSPRYQGLALSDPPRGGEGDRAAVEERGLPGADSPCPPCTLRETMRHGADHFRSSPSTEADKPRRWQVQESILQSIGRTPLVRLRRLTERLQASIYV